MLDPAPLKIPEDVVNRDILPTRKPYPDKIDKAEKDKRVRIVMEYILDDYLSIDIEKQAMDKWKITDRQARRYIRDARLKLQEHDDELIKDMRARKIKTLEKLKRSLKEIHKGSPAGIMAVLRVEKEISELQNLYPAKKVELTGKDGQPIQTESLVKNDIDYTKLSTDTLEEIVNARKTNVKTSGN